MAGYKSVVELEEEDADIAIGERREEAGDVWPLVDALYGGGEGMW